MREGLELQENPILKPQIRIQSHRIYWPFLNIMVFGQQGWFNYLPSQLLPLQPLWINSFNRGFVMQIFTFPRKAFWLVRYLGLFRGILVVLVKPLAIVAKFFSKSEWYWQFVERQFDQRHNVDTVEIVPVDNLSLTEKEAAQAVFYEPTPIMEFGYIISRLGVNYSEFTFLDLGSGKGRALLMATWFDFKMILGVEISKPLHETAKQNILTFHKAGKLSNDTVLSVCEDAAHVALPSGPLIIFLFNPFHEQVLGNLVDNLRKSLKQDFRPTIILYGNPIHDDVFKNTSWLKQKKCELRGWYSVYEADSESF